MKIGVMMRHLGEKGGISVYSRIILKNLLELKTSHEFFILLSPQEESSGFGGYPNAREVEIKAPNKLLWDQYYVPREAKRLKLDILFNPKLSIPLRIPCKTVLTLVGLEQFAQRHLYRRFDRLYFQTAMPLFCRKADAIITMTRTGLHDLKKYLGVPPDKVSVIPLAYNEYCRPIRDSAVLQAVSKRYQLPEKFVLFVGGITPLKNLPTLLKAMSQIMARGFPHKLVLVGFHRWKFEKDLAMIEKLGMQDDIIQTGFVSDEELPAIYNQAAAFVLPSFYEGFGIPILEAQACGCPVVVSTGGAMTEVAGAGGALSFDPNQPEALAEVLETVLTNELVRDQLYTAGLENVKQYTWDKTAHKIMTLFEDLVRVK